tara:strand:+ start:5182 stop:6915 length:1734 start_codon:yes stop_codon:yes gene_type:complete
MNKIKTILPIVTRNKDISKELKYINDVSRHYENKQPQQMLQSIQNYLREQNDGEYRIKTMCVMNETVMPYIIKNYNNGYKPLETTVTVYNIDYEKQSHWYNYFYGIIFGIEETQNKKLTLKELQSIYSELQKLCIQFSKQKKTGGNFMTGGISYQLIPLIVLAASSIVSSQGFQLPSQRPLDTSKLSSHTTLSDDVTSAAAKIIPVAGATAAVFSGDWNTASTILQSTFYAESAVVGFDAVGLNFLGLTSDTQRENYGKIANEVATQFREFIQTGKAIVTPTALISETLENNFNTKTIRVNDREINSDEIKAIKQSFQFITSMAETIVFEDYAQTYIAEWHKFSTQSSNPAGDGKGPLASMGIGSGKKVTFETVSEHFRTFVTSIEDKYNKLLKSAKLSDNDILAIKNVKSAFEQLYYYNEITIDEDTMNTIIKLSDSISKGKDGGILDLFKKDKFFDDIRKDWNNFKSEVDGVELNISMSWLILGVKYIGALSALLWGIYTRRPQYITLSSDNKTNRSWTQWLSSFGNRKKSVSTGSTQTNYGGKKIKRSKKTKSKKSKVRKSKKNHKRRNKKRVK